MLAVILTLAVLDVDKRFDDVNRRFDGLEDWIRSEIKRLDRLEHPVARP
jgi:hypothetical protein